MQLALLGQRRVMCASGQGRDVLRASVTEVLARLWLSSFLPALDLWALAWALPWLELGRWWCA